MEDYNIIEVNNLTIKNRRSYLSARREFSKSISIAKASIFNKFNGDVSVFSGLRYVNRKSKYVESEKISAVLEGVVNHFSIRIMNPQTIINKISSRRKVGIKWSQGCDYVQCPTVKNDFTYTITDLNVVSWNDFGLFYFDRNGRYVCCDARICDNDVCRNTNVVADLDTNKAVFVSKIIGTSDGISRFTIVDDGRPAILDSIIESIKSA